MNTIDEGHRRRYGDDGREDIDPIVTSGQHTPEAEGDPDDFSALTYDQAVGQIDKIFELGHKRRKQLDGVLKQDSNGDYNVPHTSKGNYSDFYDQANYDYLTKKYPWLHSGTQVGIDEREAEESHESLEKFMASIPHDDWQSFIADVASLEDDYCLDPDGASELEIEEQSRWMTEDGGPALIKAMIADTNDAYEGYLFTKITPDMIWEWSRKTDHYPESEGEGSVYMDMDRYAKERKTQEWFLEQLDDDVAGWVAIKRGVYDERISNAESELRPQRASDAFDAMLRQMASEHESVAYVYNQASNSDLWEMFLQAFPDEHRQTGDPYWYQWQQNYDTPKLWKPGFVPPDDHRSQNWTVAYAQALDELKEADWFIRMIGSWKNRPPEGHPEFKFEALVREALEAEPDPDDPEMFVRTGGGVAEDVIYEDDNILVLYPRNVESLNYHLRRFGAQEVPPNDYLRFWKGNDKDVFVIIGKDKDDLLGHRDQREIGIIVGDYDKVVGYDGRYDVAILNNLLTHPQYGKSVKRMLLRYYRDQAKGTSNYFPALMQLGGAAEMRRLSRYGDLDLSTYGIPLGLHYIDRKKYRLAAKAFNRDPKTIDPKGVWLIYDHVTDLIGVFKNEEGAQAVFDGETHDMFSYYYERNNWPSVDDVTPFLTPEAIKHIREVLVNRRVWFPDGGPDGEGEYVLLSPKLLAGYDDETILGWLEKPSQQDVDDGVFDDIFREIRLTGVDLLVSAGETSVYNGYQKAALSAIDGIQHKWGTSTTKATKSGPRETFEVYVLWPVVKHWATDYKENNGEHFDGSLEDLALAANRETSDPSVDNMQPSWSDVKKVDAAAYMDRIFSLEQPEATPLPLERGQLPLAGVLENEADEETRAQELMSQYPVENPNYDLAAAEKQADERGDTQFQKRKVAQGYLRRLRGESIGDPDAPEAMPDMLSGVPVEFENQVKAILKDSSEANGYKVNELKITFDPSKEHSEEDIDASDGRLYNVYGPHLELLISYVAEPDPGWTATQKVYTHIRASVVNSFKNYTLFHGYGVNPDVLDLPRDTIVFIFRLQWSKETQQEWPQYGGAEQIPF